MSAAVVSDTLQAERCGVLVAPPLAAPAPVTADFGPRLVVGMVGVLIAVTVAAVNDHVTDIAIFDIQGGLMLGHDEADWIRALFQAGQVVGMAFAPWCAVTFSLRRFCMVMTGMMALFGLLCPFASSVPMLYLLRALQGLAGGFLPPLLITVALRFCPPSIRLFGFAGYALSATFGPNMAMPLAAWWNDYLGWPWIFWHIIPACIIAIAAVGYGLPQDPMRLDRFRSFDWVGLVIGAPGIAALTIAVHQGDRLNWLASPLFCLLLFGGGALFCFFLLNEWFHPSPVFKLQMLKRRNIVHSIISIATLLVVFLCALAIPLYFMATVRDFRPLEIAPIALTIALPQLIVLPLLAALLNIDRVDSRYIFITGLIFVALSCYLGTHVTSDWMGKNFYLMAALLALGQPMCVVPILMTVTYELPSAEGPYISAMFNCTKGFAAVIMTTVVEGYAQLRMQYHSEITVSQLGAHPAAVQERLGVFGQRLVGPLGDAATRGDVALHMLARQAFVQDYTLAMADCYRVITIASIALIVFTLVAGVRVRPPRAIAPRSKS